MTAETDYTKAAIKYSIACVTLGLLIALLITVLLGGFSIVGSFPFQLILAVISAYFYAYFYGYVAGKVVFRTKASGFKLHFIGIFLAWFCLFSIAVTGSVFSFLEALGTESVGDLFENYILKPLITISFVGSITASLLGLFWANRMKKEISNVEEKFSLVIH